MDGSWFWDRDSSFWLWAGRVATLLTFGALASLGLWVYDLWRRAQRAERRDRLAARLSTRPVALLISFAGVSIEADVRAYLAECFPKAKLAAIPEGSYDPDPAPDRFALMCFEHQDTLTPELAGSDLERLRNVVNALKAEGYSEVHLFMQSTVAFGCAVGALFTNWGTVHVYHATRRTPAYEHWFCLDEVKRAPPQRSVVDEVAVRLAPLVRRAAVSAEPSPGEG
jgi:hypothetical protein